MVNLGNTLFKWVYIIVKYKIVYIYYIMYGLDLNGDSNLCFSFLTSRLGFLGGGDLEPEESFLFKSRHSKKL